MYAENKKAVRSYESPLERWEVGSYEQIGEAKRTNMITTVVFRNSILNNFIVGEGYSALKNLAKFMHEDIFFNDRLNEVCHGVVPRSANPTSMEAYQSVNLLAKRDASLDNSKHVDPFEHRFKNRAEICKDLGTLLKNAVDAARSRL
ncbi:hypothetical protein EV175_006347 [Coemansia sp. RSA 1933]|nr:hypothetical protein EV175_006347 [Coemansia sp. RSA 1933]